MYNLQAMIRRGISNTNNQFERLGYLSTNISNVNSVGYKSVRFEQILNEEDRLSGVLRTDFSQGSFWITENPYDVAIKGPGFIPITKKTGEVVYTRNGSFKTDNEGNLTTIDGSIVAGGIKVPLNYDRFEIKPNGTVQIYEKEETTPKVLGKIPLIQFHDPESLEVINGGYYRETTASGEPVLIENHDYFAQNGLERSNVNTFDTVGNVLRLNASMLASTRLIKAIDDMYSKSINLRQ